MTCPVCWQNSGWIDFKEACEHSVLWSSSPHSFVVFWAGITTELLMACPTTPWTATDGKASRTAGCVSTRFLLRDFVALSAASLAQPSHVHQCPFCRQNESPKTLMSVQRSFIEGGAFDNMGQQQCSSAAVQVFKR